MNKKIIAISVLLAGMLLCSACSMPRSSRLSAKRSSNSVSAANAVNKKQEEEQSTADIPKKDPTVYVIVKNDLQNYQLTLRDLSGASQICYEYTDGTDFFDKYGSDTPISEFSEGRLVVVSRRSNDILGTVSFTDETWSYENIINYSIDEIKNRMDIADTGYQLHENVQVFSDGVQTTLSAVGENDILNVYGIDRTICSIVVATGHGTLSLTNTELFEGGWVNLGTKVYAKITGNMTMELPEGVYDFSVANDGYGDSGEVLIRRDKVTTIDLNDYKGEGPKFCKLTFDVGVDGAILTINGKKINHTKPQELRYGVYTLGVFADGYDAWTKQLVINSPTAKIDILLSEESDTQVASNAEAGTSQSDSDKSDSNKSGSKDSESGKSGSNGGNSNSSDEGKRLAGSKAGSRSGSKTGSGGGSSSGGTGSSQNENGAGSALANAALGSSLASIITGGESSDYLETLSELVESLDKMNKSSSGNQ